jgi:hypothetical protein
MSKKEISAPSKKIKGERRNKRHKKHVNKNASWNGQKLYTENKLLDDEVFYSKYFSASIYIK